MKSNKSQRRSTRPNSFGALRLMLAVPGQSLVEEAGGRLISAQPSDAMTVHSVARMHSPVRVPTAPSCFESLTAPRILQGCVLLVSRTSARLDFLPRCVLAARRRVSSFGSGLHNFGGRVQEGLPFA